MARCCPLLVALLSFWVPLLASAAESSIDNYRIYTEHPRLFLRAQRLRLLRRERERNSMRWEQLKLVISGGAPMPEPGFANALFYRVSDDKAAARGAIEAALKPETDLRQVALVYDWCQDQVAVSEKAALARRLRDGLRPLANFDFDTARAQVLAAIALGGEQAGDDDAASEAALRRFIEIDWQGKVLPALRSGTAIIRGRDTMALMEILHAFRDNLNADLRLDYTEVFKQLPLFDLLSYYPPPYPAAGNEFHIPFSATTGEPDLRLAALSRAGELAMVAFDSNAPESQVLQGWLMNDRFLMRGLFGIPYEFLWANPYQPGLSYYHVPLVLHDDRLGRLLVRSSWEDDAIWAGYIDGYLQEFRDGRVVPLDPKSAREPLDLDEATIFFSSFLSSQAVSSQARRFQSGSKAANDIFLVGLAPRTAYHVEVDDEEMREMPSDPGGILYLKGVRATTPIRFTPESAPGPPPATSR